MVVVFMLWTLLVFYGYRVRSDTYRVAYDALRPHDIQFLRPPSLIKRVWRFLGVPGDGLLYLLLLLFPLFTRTAVFAAVVADATAEMAARGGLSWVDAHAAVVRAMRTVLGEELRQQVGQRILQVAREKFEASKI